MQRKTVFFPGNIMLFSGRRHQFGKYNGKSFSRLLENDVSYILYVIKNLQREEAFGISKPEGHSKDSTFVDCALSFLRDSGCSQL